MENNISESPDNLVTIGFKTTQTRKRAYIQRAVDLGLTLSSYIDTQLVFTEEEIEKNEKQILELRDRLRYFEESRLLHFLKKMQGRVFDFIDEDGNAIHVEVKRIEDVFKVLLHSFKFE